MPDTDARPADAPRVVRALRGHARARGIPDRHAGALVIAAWNVAELGDRTLDPRVAEVVAEVIGWFDIVALQAVGAQLGGLAAVREHLPPAFALVMSDAEGPVGRQAFLFDGRTVELGEEIDRVTIPAGRGELEGVEAATFASLDFGSGPFLATFRAAGHSVSLVNTHLRGGPSGADADPERRALRALVLAEWACRRHADDRDRPGTLVLGDLNLPRFAGEDPVRRALGDRGLLVDEARGSVIAGRGEGDGHHQAAIVTSAIAAPRGHGVFDFDTALTAPGASLGVRPEQVSDHRPLWLAFDPVPVPPAPKPADLAGRRRHRPLDAA